MANTLQSTSNLDMAKSILANTASGANYGGYGDIVMDAIKQGYSYDNANAMATAIIGGSGLTKSDLDKMFNYSGSGTKTQSYQMYDPKTGYAVTQYYGATTPTAASQALGYTQNIDQTDDTDKINYESPSYDEAVARAGSVIDPKYEAARLRREKQNRDLIKRTTQALAARGYGSRAGGKSQVADYNITQDMAADIDTMDKEYASAKAELANSIYTGMQTDALNRFNSLVNQQYQENQLELQRQTAATTKESAESDRLYRWAQIQLQMQEIQQKAEAEGRDYRNDPKYAALMMRAQELENQKAELTNQTLQYNLDNPKTYSSGGGGSTVSDKEIVRSNLSAAQSDIWSRLNSGVSVGQIEAEIWRDAGKYTQLGLDPNDLIVYARSAAGVDTNANKDPAAELKSLLGL